MTWRRRPDTLPRMDTMARGGAHANIETWPARLRRLWRTRRPRDPACVLDGPGLHHKRPVAHLGDTTCTDLGGMVLLLDHRHPGAMETLQALQTKHRPRFDAGAIVVGIENLPDGAADVLVAYRRAARVPVFAVDAGRPADRLLLQEALIATRIAAALTARQLP